MNTPAALKRVRRFRIVDAMVLVAASGVAFWFIQHQRLPEILQRRWFPTQLTPFLYPEDGDLAALSSSILIPFTLALGALRLVPPRPPRVRLSSLPGTLACATAALMMGFLIFEEYRMYSRAYQTVFLRVEPVSYLVRLNYQPAISYAVATSWAILACSGRWRTEPSWLDRAGRVVGWSWILLIPMRWFSPL
jgi:hypothetical protein